MVTKKEKEEGRRKKEEGREPTSNRRHTRRRRHLRFIWLGGFLTQLKLQASIIQDRAAIFIPLLFGCSD
ncbi:hypothetical protein L3X38_001427 [Prunus dulcis]|uniref:Uncharacterized protein n=1 Tax=Prunus dulcis TaxID=3755 RepID=A0AAD4WS26_PRUDU|nr:hypothetical protein L3X38_001427 [Prunus dulcis]